MNLLSIEKEKFLGMIPQIEKDHNVTVLLAYVRGSYMYGTNTEKSDVDITFVYQQPTETILRGDYKEQINVDKDTVGYEIERFLDLLSKNNPNVLEALDIPEDCLIVKNTCMSEVLDQKVWLSKLTENTLLGYANSQIKKASGLNKKINNPIVERKEVTDFCYVIIGDKSFPLKEWLDDFIIEESKCGLVKVPNGKGLYGMYIDFSGEANFRGFLKDETSTQLRVSSIPEEFQLYNEAITIWYNQDGYESWCKDYASYKQWEAERNVERYDTNKAHGHGFDSKNMMHLFRLLSMAFGISCGEGLKVREDDTEWLMEIRRGEIEYKDLVEDSNTLIELIKLNYQLIDLQEKPDFEKKKDILLNLRKQK